MNLSLCSNPFKSSLTDLQFLPDTPISPSHCNGLHKRTVSAMEHGQLQYSSTATSRRMSDSNNVKAPVGGSNTSQFLEKPPGFSTEHICSEVSRGANPTIGSDREYAQLQSASAAASRRSSYSNIVKAQVGGSYTGQPFLGKPPGSGTEPTSSERSRGVNPTIGCRNPQERVAQQPCYQPPPPSSHPSQILAHPPCNRQSGGPTLKLFDGPYYVEGGEKEALANALAFWTGVASENVSDSWKTNTPTENFDEGLQNLHMSFLHFAMAIQMLSRELVYVHKNFVPKQNYEKLQAKYYHLQDKYGKLQALHTQDVQAPHAAANESINTLKATLEKTSSRASEARELQQ